jgi:hypothetical protein
MKNDFVSKEKWQLNVMFGLLLLGVNFVYYGLKGSIFDEIDDLMITACYIVVQD